MTISSQGFIKLPTILAIVLGLAFGASAFLNYQQHQVAEQDKKLLQGEIADLRYQVKQDQLAAAGASPTPSAAPSPSSTPTPNPSASPAVAGTASISISQFGVKLTAIDPIADLTYAPGKSGIYPTAAFTTQDLAAKYSGCKAGALGSIARKPKGQTSKNTLVKTIGEYSYFYLPPTFTCVTDQAGRDAIAAARAALTNGVLPTLSN